MNFSFPELEKFINWLLICSAQAGLLVLMVLLVQRVFRRRLTSRWRFALWWVVLIRLVLPVGPESALSVFNYVSLRGKIAETRPAPSFTPSVQSETKMVSAPVERQAQFVSEPDSIQISDRPEQTPPSPVSDQIQHQPTFLNRALGISGDAATPRELVIPALTIFWMLGIIVLSGCVSIQVFRFRRKLREAETSSNANARALLDNCRREFGVSRKIELVETDAVKSPALFGLFRLKLLLPRGLANQFSETELRYIFLHELAHVKRGDLWLNWLVTILQIAHWFNPLIWLGFARLRADRELACDELALLRAGENAGTSYGGTIIKLLETVSHPAAIPGLIGILEDKKQMRRRIQMIANFRKPGRWSALAAAILLAALATTALTDAQTRKSTESSSASDSKKAEIRSISRSERPNLIGTVHTKDGSPLPATVFISTAAPKIGTSTFCPSCYADCAKHSKADAQGNFKIESLDPQLTFRVLAVAKNYKPKFVDKVDPAKGPVSISLEPIESADAAPDRSLRGRVVNPEGEPVEGAAVEMVGIEARDGSGSFGAISGIDPLAVTDEKGEFLITATKPFEMMDVKVTARTFADKNFSKLTSGASHDLMMTEGATVSGRVLFDGKPLGGVSVGISGVDRSAGTYVGNFEVGTDTNGNFALLNVPPDTDYYIYGIMNTMKSFGAIPIQTIHAGKDGEITKVGDLVVGPAHHLAGRVELADGAAVPANTRLLVSREKAWDSMQLILDKNGRFETGGIPSETISLSARVKGYHVSGKNPSLDRLNPFELIGKVEGDVTNLVLLMEKGPGLRPNFDTSIPDSQRPRNLPLHGTEGGVDHSQDWIISGRVLDSVTKEPIPSFRVTQGEDNPFRQMSWDSLHSVEGTNGVYVAYVSKHFSQPEVKVDANGYLPAAKTVLPEDATNVDFLLTRGSGPSGTVVLPNGKPAANATVILLTGQFNQALLNQSGELRTMWSGQNDSQKSGTDGSFAFKPEFGTKYFAAGSQSGFAIVNIESLKTNSMVTLQPFGRITGTLKRGSALSTNEDLDLTFANGSSGNLSRLNLNNHAVTDSRGRFEFDNVPPGNLEISARRKFENSSSWSSIPLKSVEINPGETLDLSIEAPDRSALPVETIHKSPAQTPIPGESIKGVVLEPDGKPAANARVALQVQGVYIQLGKASFNIVGSPSDKLVVSTAPDGSFTLPMYENAESVAALDEKGFVQIALGEFKASPKLKLQKWGRIEGSLEINHHPGANQSLIIDPAVPNSKNIFYSMESFRAKTDDHGRFLMTFIPAGEQTISRGIETGNGGETYYRLGNVEVRPGETAHVDLAQTGRKVIGKVNFNVSNEPSDWKFVRGTLHNAGTVEALRKFQQMKTKEEKAAFLKSEAAKNLKTIRSFPVIFSPDGSFHADVVPAGEYELELRQIINPTFPPRTFVSTVKLTVPPATNQNEENVPVDLGTIKVQEITPPAASKKASE